MSDLERHRNDCTCSECDQRRFESQKTCNHEWLYQQKLPEHYHMSVPQPHDNGNTNVRTCRYCSLRQQKSWSDDDAARLRVENQIRAQEYAILIGLWKETSERAERAEAQIARKDAATREIAETRAEFENPRDVLQSVIDLARAALAQGETE